MLFFSFVADVRDQLSSAENRCNLLEKQLEYMRQLFTAAEKDRTDAVRRAAELQQYRSVELKLKPCTVHILIVWMDVHSRENRCEQMSLGRSMLKIYATYHGSNWILCLFGGSVATSTILTGSHRQWENKCKRNCSILVGAKIVTEVCNIAVNDFDAKKSARYNRVLVVTKSL